MKKIKSITIVSNDYPAPGHASYVFVQQLVYAMNDMGVTVNVIATQSVIHALVHKERLLPLHSKGVTKKGVEYDIYRPYTLSFGNNNPFKKLTRWYNRHTVVSLLRRIGGEVLYSHFWSNVLPVYEYASQQKRPLFVACGEGDNALDEMVATMPKKELKKLSEAVTGVVSVSSENKRKCIKYGLCTPENVDVFPNCVNTSLFHKMDVTELKKNLGITETDFVICFVGGFTLRKGPDRVAQAVKNLNDPKIKVLFIGKQFDGYGYDFNCPGIIHKGSLDHDLMPQYMNCADIFVLPTQKEGCSNAVVEALAIGLPVVSSDRPFNDDILNEENSIRVNPDDVDAITEAIRKLRNDAVLRKSMSDYSLSRHEGYTIEGRAKRILDFINQQSRKSIMI